MTVYLQLRVKVQKFWEQSFRKQNVKFCYYVDKERLSGLRPPRTPVPSTLSCKKELPERTWAMVGHRKSAVLRVRSFKSRWLPRSDWGQRSQEPLCNFFVIALEI
jgi:hypothetical protein